jgi:sterol desaturase/sphingolipid hydroxylase (fatty acid hydroxylase superfamily)
VFLALEATLGAAPWRATVDAAPLWLLVVGAVALGDLLIYWFHHACHHFEVLWRFHRVHHTVEHLDWLAAHREHPLDGLVTQLLLNLPAMLLGLPLRAIGGVIVFRGLWAIFIHSNVRVPLGPLRFVFGAPELHHWHHAKVERTAHNFANLAPYWDWVFGTYHADLSPETYPLGVPGDAPKSYWRHLLEPLGVRSRAASAVRDRPPRECALDR